MEQAPRAEVRELWIFAYGSLMWRPDFPYAEAQRARLTGYHRSFCIYSTHHRGAPDRPGLVLGLDRGGACEGIAYRIATPDAAFVVQYLRRRELIYGVYREARVPVLLGQEHREAQALAYTVEPAHPAYAGRLALQRQLAIIRGAEGVSGTNLDYLANTARHLCELGIRERAIERLMVLAGSLPGRRQGRTELNASSEAMMRQWRRRPIEARKIRPAEHKRFLYRLRLSDAAAQAVEAEEEPDV